MTVHYRIVVFFTILVASASSQSAFAENSKTYIKSVLACKEPSHCAYTYQTYKKVVEFRKALLASLKASNIRLPYWVADAPKGRVVESPMYPVILGGQVYLMGHMCEQHNCPHQLKILYAPYQSNRVVGRYAYPELIGPGRSFRWEERWFGNPSASEQNVILDYAKTNGFNGMPLPIKY